MPADDRAEWVDVMKITHGPPLWPRAVNGHIPEDQVPESLREERRQIDAIHARWAELDRRDAEYRLRQAQANREIL